ncbi:MAG: sigma-70 family RNA polymerase sigma factor [Fuerstiella sp.]
MLSSKELSGLWRKHAAALLLMARGHCRGIDSGLADDCVQEAFIRLAGQTPQPDDPAAWLTRVVRNAAIDAIRTHQRRTSRERIAARERPTWLQPVNPSDTEHLSPVEVQQALQQLDDMTRDIIVARIWNDMTFRQIAAAFDLSHATCQRRYETGIQQLRTIITVQENATCQ